MGRKAVFCKQCGRQIEEDLLLCKFCGSLTREETAQSGDDTNSGTDLKVYVATPVTEKAPIKIEVRKRKALNGWNKRSQMRWWLISK